MSARPTFSAASAATSSCWSCILSARDEDLAELIDNLLQQLKEPFLIEGFEIFTSASIGVSVYPDHGRNYEMLRRAADTAMYRIKEGTKGGAALFDPDMGRAMTARMKQEQRLRLAVRDGRFCCAFQPKVDIRSQEVVGVEALIRLRDEDGEIQAPGDFIGLATELGLIDDMAHLALDQIVRSMDLIDEAFGPHVTVSINIAAKQACNIQFMRDFCDELKSTNYAERFIVEVTEDAFVAKSLFQSQVLPMLRDIGARVSIDDFGTGYSSLAALADITADELKIDRSFITGYPQALAQPEHLEGDRGAQRAARHDGDRRRRRDRRRGRLPAGRHPHPLRARLLLFPADFHGRSDDGTAWRFRQFPLPCHAAGTVAAARAALGPRQRGGGRAAHQADLASNRFG